MTVLLRLSSAALALAVVATLGGCGSDSAMDSISSLNPFKKDKPVAEGNRTSLLAVSDPTRGITNGRASIGTATALAAWSQPGGTPTNDPGNVAGALRGVHYWSMKGGQSGFGNGLMGLSTSKGRGISARPVAADGIVYVYDAAGIVSGFKVANSGATWHVGAYPAGASDSVGGGGLAVAGGRVYAATGYGELLAIDAATSSIVWRVKLDAPARSAPAVGGGKIVVTAQSGVVQAFDATTGAAGWRASTEVSGRVAGWRRQRGDFGRHSRGCRVDGSDPGVRSRHRYREMAGIDHRWQLDLGDHRSARRLGEPGDPR